MVFKNPALVHAPLASYSHQMEVSGKSRWLVMAGQIGMDKDGFVPEDVMSQTEVALDNVLLNLKEAGMEKENLAKLVFYFVGPHEAEQRRSVILKKLGEHRPCTTVLFVVGLASPDYKVEIDAWACSE